MTAERRRGDELVTLQSRLEDAEAEGLEGVTGTTVNDPVGLLHRLVRSGHFHRDARSGRLFHPGMVSLRETVSEDSLHVSVDGNRLTAHVDRESPLVMGSDGESAYSVRRAVQHNLAGMAEDLMGLLRGRQGDHSCELDCEWVPNEGGLARCEPDLLDRAGGAWSVQVEVRVAGSLDETRLRSALGVVLRGRVLEHDPLEVLECGDDRALHAARARLQDRAVAVGVHPPLRVCLARHAGADVVMLSLNHAAADAFAALAVLESIARAYAGEPQPSLEFLAALDLPVRPASTSASVPVRAGRLIVERLRNVRDRPARVVAEEPCQDAGCGYQLVALSAEETRHAVGVDHGRDNTNVLVAALHLAIGDWNRRHGHDQGRVGILVQADLRPSGWRADRVANLSVSARMSTSRDDRASATTALQTITAQIARNKRARTGVALIAALDRAGLLALWAKQSIVVLKPLTANEQIDAAMLCNLGWLAQAPSFGPQAGEAVGPWFSTPARTPLSLCLGAVTIGDRLHLTFRYPHRLFGRGAAGRFAEDYVERLRCVGDIRP